MMNVGKTLSIALLLFITITGSAFANNAPVITPDFKGGDHFIHTFPQASAIEYKVKGQITEVSFTWNGLQLQAFYDAEGTLLATSRQIQYINLPLSAQISLKKQYAGFVSTEAMEFNDDGGLSYYVTVVGPKKAYLLHISSSGTISVFKKMKN